MNKLNLHIILMLLLGMVLALPTTVVAQNRNCEETLREYVRLFEAGKYDQLIALVETENRLGQCDKKQKELIYEVISSAYLEVDKLEQGLDYIRRIFRNNHYYDAGSSKYSLEPFLTNLNKFKVRPIMAIGINAGYDIPFFWVTDYYNIIDPKLLTTTSAKHKPQASFHAGVNLQYNLFKYLSLHTEANYQDTRYSRTIYATNDIPELYRDGFRNSSITFKENLRQLNVPVYARFNLAIGKSKFVPGFYGGLFYRFVMASQARLTGEMSRFIGQDFTDVEDSDFIITEATAEGIDMRKMRNRHQFGPLVGMALTYQVRYFTMFADARYMIDLRKFEKNGTRYDNNLLVDYYYLDTDSRLTNLSLSLGFTYNFIHQIKQRY
ncbi:hypothetical protein BH09BAC1_BH09BAC1_28350 [soil metagenome]